MKTVTTGTDQTLSYASGSVSTDTLLPRQAGSSSYDLDESDKQAEIAVDAAVAGIGAHGWAMAWTSFEVDGSSTTFAKVNVNNVDYQMSIGAMGAATSRGNVSIFLEDITNDSNLRKIDNSDRIDEFEFEDAKSEYIDVLGKQFEDRLTKEVTGDLQPGHTYRVGVRADVWATAELLGYSYADVHSGGDYNGYIRYDDITVTWP